MNLGRPRYVINLSRHDIFSAFLAEALAMKTPALTSREIAENLEVIAKFFNNELVVVEKAFVKTWGGVMRQYLGKLY